MRHYTRILLIVAYPQNACKMNMIKEQDHLISDKLGFVDQKAPSQRELSAKLTEGVGSPIAVIFSAQSSLNSLRHAFGATPPSVREAFGLRFITQTNPNLK